MRQRMIFMGTPDFAVPALNALHAAGHAIVGVYSQPPRPSGRGKKLRPSPVQAAAEALGLPTFTPLNFKGEDARAQLANLKPDVAVVAAYGLILPQAVLDMAPKGFFNIHASLLPRWRGAAPIQRAIEAGDAQTGITIMRMEAGLDTGPMCLKQSYPLSSQTTAQMAHDALSAMGGSLIVEAMAKLDDLKCGAQDDDLATYAPKIDKAEAKLDFTALDAATALRKIHALSPFPGAYCMLEGKRLKLLEVEFNNGDGPAGTILDDQLTIACASGAIRPVRVQLEGKGALDADTFLKGLRTDAPLIGQSVQP